MHREGFFIITVVACFKGCRGYNIFYQQMVCMGAAMEKVSVVPSLCWL
jgi:hypothetical protein